MDFLDRFPARDRDRLSAVATLVRLGRGEFLLRRGERGGDLFRVAEGELEVIDTRSQPAVVLDVLGRGSLVGEMAFLDQATRAADVRAAEGALCQRWERAALVKVLEDSPSLAASFYKVIAELVTERQRVLATNAVAGTLGATGQGRRGTEQAATAARSLATGLRDRLMEAEPLIRRDRGAARREILAALRTFTESMTATLGRMTDDDQAAAGEVLGRELHPYLMRSHLGEQALARPSGHASDPQALGHVHAGHPEGDGPLGEFIDEWLLGLPTARGLRERSALAADLVLERLPPDGLVRMELVNLGSGALFAALLPHLDRLRGELWCVDGNRDALAAVDQGVRGRVRDLRVKLVQEDLGGVVLGGARARMSQPGILVADGLADHLPERVLASFLEGVAAALAPGGHLVLTALAESPDEAVYRHLIAWPTVRHRPAGLAGLVAGAGFDEVRTYEAGTVGVVVVGQRTGGPGAPRGP